MAAAKRKKRKKQKVLVRIELTLRGLAGLGVVCFCIFLWMFLLGVWTGQDLLQSGEEAPDPVAPQENGLESGAVSGCLPADCLTMVRPRGIVAAVRDASLNS